MKFKSLIGTGLLTGALALSSVAGAAVTFDPSNGSGFIGKGDVQTAFGWNNKQLQSNLIGVTFTYEAASTTVTETSWDCTNTKNEKVQDRERTTTSQSSTSGVVAAVARDGKNQITGISLNGYNGSPSTTATSTSEGPKLNSCPTDWELTSAGDPVVITDETTGGLYATHSGIRHQLA